MYTIPKFSQRSLSSYLNVENAFLLQAIELRESIFELDDDELVAMIDIIVYRLAAVARARHTQTRSIESRAA